MGQLKERGALVFAESNDKNIFWVDKWISGTEGSAGTYESRRVKESELKLILGAGLQPLLVDGVNFSTVNGNSLLAAGDIVIPSNNIGNTDLVLSTSGTRKLSFASALSSNIIAFRNSLDTVNNFQLNGDGSGGWNVDGKQIKFGSGSSVTTGSGGSSTFLTAFGLYNCQVQSPLVLNDNILSSARHLYFINGGYDDDGTKTIVMQNGTAPSVNRADSYKQYSADQGGVAGRASVHFRSEEGTINSLGYFNGFGYASGAALGARWDVKGQGALGMDKLARINNSVGTADFFQVNGDGTYWLSSDGGSLSNSFSKIADGRMFMAKSGGNFIEMNPSGANRFYNPAGGWDIGGNTNIGTLASGGNTGNSTWHFYAGNLQIGTGLIASGSADGAIWMSNRTAPSGNAADRHWYYSADIVAGNAAPHFRTELGHVIKLFKGAALTADSGLVAGVAYTTNEKDMLTNLQTRVLELEARLQANGLIF